MVFSGNYQTRYEFTFESFIIGCFHIGSCHSWQVNTLIDFSIIRQNLRKKSIVFSSKCFYSVISRYFLLWHPIPSPQSNERLAGNSSTDTKNCTIINFTLNLFIHIISILQNLVQEKGLGQGAIMSILSYTQGIL